MIDAAGGEADVTVNLVNVPGTELGTILLTKETGTILFFSMSTSFTAAALGAEGLGRATTMIVGNGHMPDTGLTALGRAAEPRRDPRHLRTPVRGGMTPGADPDAAGDGLPPRSRPRRSARRLPPPCRSAGGIDVPIPARGGARPYREVTAAELPWLIEELDGVAEGAGADPLAVFAASIEELEAQTRR